MYNSKIPIHQPSFEEISKQMRINANILMKEISEHSDREIERIRKEIGKAEYIENKKDKVE